MLFELFQVLAHGVVSSHSRAYEETAHFPRQGWWVKQNSSQTQGPEHAQKRVQGGPGQRQSAVPHLLAASQPLAHCRNRLAQKGECRLRAIQAAKPAEDSGSVSHPMGIFEGRRRRFGGAALHKILPQGLTAGPANCNGCMAERTSAGR